MNRPIMLTDSALEAMLSRRAARVRAEGLEASIARSIAAAPQRRPSPFGRPRRLVFPMPRMRTLSIVAAGALVTALVGTAAIGSRLFEQSTRTPAPALAPTPASTSSPRTMQLGGPTLLVLNGLVAVSASEAWAANGAGVWHYVDGRWNGPTLPDGVAPDELSGLAVDPAGARVAIAARTGIALFEAGKWTWVWHPHTDYTTHSVAFASDGSLWTQGITDGWPHPIVNLRQIDGFWRRTVVDCPVGGGVSIAATSDGAIWTGGIGYSGTWGLAGYDGARCTAVAGIATGDDIVDLDADARGGLVAAVFDNRPGPPWRQSIIRFDGSTWQTLKVDEAVNGWGSSDLAVTPSGEVYLSMNGEILHYDAAGGPGRAWQIVASIGPDAGRQLSVGPDGSIWYSAPWGIGEIARAGN